MKRRAVISFIICLVNCILSLLPVMLALYLNDAKPNMNDSLLVPANVSKVNDNIDITVQIYPVGPISHIPEKDPVNELKLNEIDKGWIINYYGGKCRLVFNVNDSSLKDLERDTRQEYYYYADLIPRYRLKATDIFKPLIRDKEDPFAPGTKPVIYKDSLEISIGQYYFSRRAKEFFVLSNVVVITVTVVINICISKAQKRRAELK